MRMFSSGCCHCGRANTYHAGIQACSGDQDQPRQASGAGPILDPGRKFCTFQSVFMFSRSIKCLIIFSFYVYCTLQSS